jgi:signal transduction histidine kinase
MQVDIDHFRLVLDNLLSNALANRLDDSMVQIQLNADHSNWILSVSNAGEILASVRHKMFEPFVSGRSHGIGLGLATVKQVCDINEWSVDITSQGGHTCFNVTGPLHVTDVPRQAPQAVKTDVKNREVAHG